MAGTLGKFARSFASLTTDSLKSGEVIDFECEVPLLAPCEIRKFFVRPCYVDLARLIVGKSLSKRQFVVSGTPGVGKSFFGVYMLVKLFKEGQAKTVYYQCKGGAGSFDPPKRYIFSMSDDPGDDQIVPHATEIYDSDRDSFNRSLDESPSGTWYIVDGMGPRFVIHANTLLITSPNESVWKQFRRLSKAKMYYVPIWALDELQQCRNLMYYDILSEEEVKEHFEKWGGSSRLVYSSADEDLENEAEYFDTGIVKTDVDSFMKAIGNMDGEALKLSHVLMHYVVNVDDVDVNKRYGGYYMAPASSYVFNKLASVFMERGRQEVSRFISGGSYTNGNDPTSILRGHLFEGLAHERLIKGGQFSVRSLETEHSEEIIVEKASMEKRFPGPSIPASQLEAGVYYRPISSNFPAIDAFCLQNNEVFLFQMTVAKSHPIAQQELKEMIISFESQNYRVRRFYFIVDKGGFSSYTFQKYRTKDKKKYVEHVDARVKAVEQYALCIPLSDVLSAAEPESGPEPKKPKTDM